MTPRQHQTLAFLERQIAEHGYAPTFDEIAGHLGVASKSTVHRLLTALERQRRIARDHDRPRAIIVLIGTSAPAALPGAAALLATFSTEALRTELNRRQETHC